MSEDKRNIWEIPQSWDLLEGKSPTTVLEPVKEPEPIKETPAEIKEEIIETVVTTKILERSELEQDKWTNIQIDSTMLSVFMSCPRKYDYVFNRHLVPVEGLSKSIIRGTIAHDALLDYWKERIKGDNYELAIKACIKRAKDALDKEIKFNSDEKLNILQNLLEYLKYIQGSSMIPIAVEKYFKVKAFEDEKLKLRIFLVGRIDLIFKTPQIPVLPVDNKTESERWFYSQMSNQFKIYSIACDVNLLGVQRIGFQETTKAQDKFKLEMLAFDQDALDEFRTITLPYWVKQLLIANEDKYYPVNSTSCVHGHFKCQFSDAYNGGICNVSREVREQKIGRYFVVGEPWDPAALL